MDDAQLDLGLGEHAADGIGEPRQTVHRGDQDVLDPAHAQLTQDPGPELGALVLADPHPQQLLVAKEVDPQGQVHRPGLDPAFGADLQVDGVQIDDRPDRIQRAALPGPDLVQDRVGDLGDQCRRDLDAVDLLEVPEYPPQEPTITFSSFLFPGSYCFLQI